MNYYNEHDAFAAQWLRNLILYGMLPAGHVDQRDIQEVTPNDLRGYTQCHFFAGIGGWSYALQLSGWPTTRSVWTGSCPCQPFSVAGKGKGTDDERHLWPEFQRLIADGKPSVCFGEQVASKDGRSWLAGVRADLEALGYGVGSADLCAAGISAPHIRQRLFWVADATNGDGWRVPDGEKYWSSSQVGGCCGSSRLGDAIQPGLQGHTGNVDDRDESRRNDPQSLRPVTEASRHCGIPDTKSGQDDFRESGELDEKAASRESSNYAARPGCGTVGQWGDYWIPCADGKARRIEPGLAPLVDGLPNRVGLIRGYGNAISPPLTAEFIKAYMECRP